MHIWTLLHLHIRDCCNSSMWRQGSIFHGHSSSMISRQDCMCPSLACAQTISDLKTVMTDQINLLTHWPWHHVNWHIRPHFLWWTIPINKFIVNNTFIIFCNNIIVHLIDTNYTVCISLNNQDVLSKKVIIAWYLQACLNTPG